MFKLDDRVFYFDIFTKKKYSVKIRSKGIRNLVDGNFYIVEPNNIDVGKFNSMIGVAKAETGYGELFWVNGKHLSVNASFIRHQKLKRI